MIAAEVGLVQLLIGLPATAVAALGIYLAYKRGTKADKVVEQAGIATESANSIGQVMAALNSLNSSLQTDNGVLRDQIALVRVDVKAIRDRLDLVESGNVDLRKKNSELERENRILHAENEAFKVEIKELRTRIAQLEKTKDSPAPMIGG